MNLSNEQIQEILAGAVARSAFIEGAAWEREQSYHLDIDEEANQRYPDKE